MTTPRDVSSTLRVITSTWGKTWGNRMTLTTKVGLSTRYSFSLHEQSLQAVTPTRDFVEVRSKQVP